MHSSYAPVRQIPEAFLPDLIAYLDVRRALIRRDFFLEYQPKVSLGSGLIEGIEALVRWDHRNLGRLRPDRFIPQLERSSLIQGLTWYVLDEAIARCAALHRQGFLLGVAVNIAPAAVIEALPRRLHATLSRHGLDAHWLTAEVTQSLPFENLSRAHSVLNAVHARGVRVSLDDFGLGYDSFARLQSLHVDEIKIDRAFVTRAARVHRDAQIVHSIVSLGHSLGIRVVAKGVEDRKTLSLLSQFGVDAVQGHYLAPALIAADLLAEFPLVSERARNRIGRRPLDLRDRDALTNETAGRKEGTWA